jgi:hypothetical protein
VQRTGDYKRLKAARIKAGDYPFKDIFDEIVTKSGQQMLDDNGILRGGVTTEKVNGKYVQPKHFTPEYEEKARKEYLIEFIKKYFDQYPDMFQRTSDLRDKFLNRLKGDRVKLRKYPELIEAMYKGKLDEIPEDLRPEENRHKS